MKFNAAMLRPNVRKCLLLQFVWTIATPVNNGRHILQAMWLAALMLLATGAVWADEPSGGDGRIELTGDLASAVDSLVVAQGDTLTANQSPQDTARFKRVQVDLDHVVEFSAKDSIVLYGRKHATMFGSGKVTYGDINMTAAHISMDMDSSQVHAIGVPDSVGELTGKPSVSGQQRRV